MFLTFQDILMKMQNFWSKNNCLILQPYDLNMGAGTFHPATAFSMQKDKNWNAAYIQPSRRPSDGRFANHPNRLQHYYQFQVVLKLNPFNIQDLYIQSLKNLAISAEKYDINFVEDDWKSPTLGASGVGWEVQCNGMEISQITYIQKLGSIPCKPVIGEITYGMERLALMIQEVENISDIIWSVNPKVSYKNIFSSTEEEFSKFNFDAADTEILKSQFEQITKECIKLAKEKNLPIVAYDFCIQASNIFNLLDSRKIFSVSERERHIEIVRNLSKICVGTSLKKYNQ